MKLLHIVGARPNFPKVAPVLNAGRRHGIAQILVHTGQHYDDDLSASLFRDLGLPKPDHQLAVGSASHAVQTARIMERLEPVMSAESPDWVVVYGDVNSTMAAAIVAAKLGIRVAHVEAGLRSHDRSMPEEINRIITDRLANLLLAPSRDAIAQLKREGEPDEEIAFVGNVMVDSLLQSLPRARESGARQSLGGGARYVVATLHRPSNTDNANRLEAIISALSDVSRSIPVLFLCHPRTRDRIAQIAGGANRIAPLNPMPYLSTIDLLEGSACVITDSGGIQEETTVLGVPCLTIRENTERPITISEGTNRLVPDPSSLVEEVQEALTRKEAARRPEGWDGRAGERVVEALLNSRSGQV